jgi:tetratricopeptide (TPR) repeat protein
MPGAQLVAEAFALHRAGDLDAARTRYEAILADDPDQPAALGLLGALEGEIGNARGAAPLFRRAAELAPQNWSNHFNLGLQLRVLHLPREALECFDRALSLRPAVPVYLRERAQTLQALNVPMLQQRAAWLEVLRASDAAIEAVPGDREAHLSRGMAFLNCGRPEEALTVFLALTGREPRCADSWVQQGIALFELSRFDEAQVALERALALNPRSRNARMNLGNVFVRAGDPQAAIACFEELLHEAPDDVSAILNMGAALYAAGSRPDALQWFERGLALRPDSAVGRKMRGYCLLSLGEYSRGWLDHELRLSDPAVPWTERDFGCHAWDGTSDVEGRTMLVWAEQGLGDTIQFSRYAIELGKLGARVVLEVHSPLVEALRDLPHVSQVVPFGARLERCDLHCALMSLPHLLGRRLPATPQGKPYLVAEAQRVREWGRRMKRRPNLGIAWSGSSQNKADHHRSLELRTLLPHLCADVRWWCVQKEVRDTDLATLQAFGAIERPELGDFAETAALLANLDAVVTVDTSVAHISGALGRPTFIMLSHAAEWRWQNGRPDTPWYASATLIRQHERGDWDAALGNMAAQVAAFVSRLPLAA